jgi:hypothetical protein
VARAGRQAGGTGGAGRDRAARPAEWREWAQRGWVSLGDSHLRGESSGCRCFSAETCPKEAEQEEWRDECLRSECRRPEDLRLAQAESEGHWWAVGVEAGGERGAGAEAGAGKRAARDAAVVSDRTRGIGVGKRTFLGGGETQ